MARQADPAVAAAVVREIERHRDGATIEQLEVTLGIPRRTLQRRLSELVSSGRLLAIGQARQRRYQAIAPAELRSDELHASRAGEQIRHHVRLPLNQRAPVGYVASFLESYRPNRDFYLDAETRARLHRRGRALAVQRPAGTYARQIMNRLLVDLSWASSRLEGNTYTRLDTQNLIELGRHAPGKDQREAQMILNHKAAIEMLVESVDQVRFDRYTVCNLHALLAENLLADPSAAGRVRTIEVGIAGTVYQPIAIPQRITGLFDLLLTTVSTIEDPFEQAFFVFIQLPYLQPFEDVNKRVSRLAANIPFIKQNLAPLSFVDVPEQDYIEGMLGVYELQRVELARDVFIWAYERSCQRYAVVRDALPHPDPLRLRNRDALTEVVNAIVRDDAPIDGTRIRELATPVVAAEDLEDFIAMAISELSGLHEGNIARYRLRPNEFRRWRDASRQQPA
jgi:Fic family protein